MRSLISRIALATVALGLVATTGCQHHSKSETFYLISTNLRLPYWKTVYQGFTNAAQEYNVTARLDGPDTYDSQAELDAFKKAVAAKPAGILVSVADAVAMRADITSAIEAGIPVITVDSDAPLSARLYFIGTNNVEAGHLGGQRLVEKMNGKGNVVFFSISGQPNEEERLKGYKDVLGQHSGIKVEDVFDTKGDPGTAFDQTEQYLAKTGADKVDAIVCLESASAKAVSDVLKRHNNTNIVLIAMDVQPETLSLIKDGTIAATVSQKPFTMGYVGLKALDEVHHHIPSPFRTNYRVDSFSKFPEFVDTGTAIVDKSNVDIYQESATAAAGK